MSADDCADVLCSFNGGVRLTVRAKPGSKHARGIKIVDIGNGKRAIEVSVSADAREGKANKALIERLAEEMGVTKACVNIASGETGRIKIIEITGDARDLTSRLMSLMTRN